MEIHEQSGLRNSSVDLQINQKAVTVFGGRHPVAGDSEYMEAFELGSLLAGANYAVMSGGYSGVMEAVSKGAREAGGTVIGVTMEIFGSLPPNPFLTREIRARNFFERLEILTEQADAFIAMRGGMGTLTEISLIWNMLQTKTMAPRPMILAGKFWKPLLRSIAEKLVISPAELDLFCYADCARDAVARLKALATSQARGRPCG
jgi:uncharacterized protein (TIGR00730 family)